MCKQLILVLGIIAGIHFPHEIGAFQVVCFYDNRAATRTLTAKLHVRDVDPTPCTHLVYMSVTVDLQTEEDIELIGTLPEIDIQQDGFLEVVAFRNRFPNLKILVSIIVNDRFVSLLRDQPRTDGHISMFQKFISTQGFHGFCFDFNLDKFDLSSPQAVEIFKNVTENLQVSNVSVMAVIPSKNLQSVHSSWINVFNTLDLVGIATFNMHQSRTSVHSALYATESKNASCLNVKCVVETWLAKGLSSDIVLIGLPTHGVSFTLANAKNNQLLAETIDVGTPGAYLREKGIRAYYEICSSIKTDSWTEYFSHAGRVPFAVSGRQWVSYDNASSLQEKVSYAVGKNLAGVFIWTLDLDDFMGMCGKPWVLTTAVTTPVTVTTTDLQPTVNIAIAPPPRYNCTREGLFVAPQNCTKFVQCSSGLVPHLMDCPDGLHFNSKEQYCDWPMIANCSAEDDLVTVEKGVAINAFTCDRKSGLYQEPKNCSSFYWCAGGLMMGLLNCPDGLLFNNVSKVCDWPMNVNCASSF